jgi:hypothetical protein
MTACYGYVTFAETKPHKNIDQICIFGRKILPQNGTGMSPFMNLVIIFNKRGEIIYCHSVNMSYGCSDFNYSSGKLVILTKIGLGRRTELLSRGDLWVKKFLQRRWQAAETISHFMAFVAALRVGLRSHRNGLSQMPGNKISFSIAI